MGFLPILLAAQPGNARGPSPGLDSRLGDGEKAGGAWRLASGLVPWEGKPGFLRQEAQPCSLLGAQWDHADLVLGPEEGALYPQGGWEEALSA